MDFRTAVAKTLEKGQVSVMGRYSRSLLMTVSGKSFDSEISSDEAKAVFNESSRFIGSLSATKWTQKRGNPSYCFR
ncbi:hypothetical protein TNCV_60311 [Trichonephila clavipes]|nr:hypothetical protein TNCV_60311 [Trichonephila clavipes]